jgi:hypothetical protein
MRSEVSFGVSSQWHSLEERRSAEALRELHILGRSPSVRMHEIRDDTLHHERSPGS